MIKPKEKLLLLLLLFVLGCGGGGHSGSRPSEDGTGIASGNLSSNSKKMDDGSPYEEFEFLAKKTQAVTIQIKSSSFDPLGIAFQEIQGAIQVFAEDDDGGGGTSASLTFFVTSGARYSLIVCSAGATTTGAFTINYPSSSISKD